MFCWSRPWPPPAGVLLISGDDGSDNGGQPVGESPASPAPAETTITRSRTPHQATHQTTHHPSTHREVHQAVRESPAPRLDPGQRQVARVVRAYVAALDARDGARACELFIPGVLSGVQFPRDRGTCGGSLSASIGYRDPRGFPVFQSSRVARIPAVAVEGSAARVTATTVTRFADNREPSVEDDVIYLRKQGDGMADREAERDALPRDRGRKHPAAGPGAAVARTYPSDRRRLARKWRIAPLSRQSGWYASGGSRRSSVHGGRAG